MGEEYRGFYIMPEWDGEDGDEISGYTAMVDDESVSEIVGEEVGSMMGGFASEQEARDFIDSELPDGWEPRPMLSFDGRGINGPDEYRTRLFTAKRGDDPYEQKMIDDLGRLFEAAPHMRAVLRMIVDRWETGDLADAVREASDLLDSLD